MIFFADIDYVDDSTTLYGRDIDSYVRTRELEYEVSENDIIKTDVKLVSRRKHLTEWLISVAHHFRCCQETIYYTIDLLDRTLAAKTYKPEFLQLIGVTSFLIASKLEEYYPADIEKLCQLTEDSYTPGEVVAMEVNILSLLNFKVTKNCSDMPCHENQSNMISKCGLIQGCSHVFERGGA